MSLATRCTQCGTVFRVVQDQLKVSEGWVRCGRCDEVFNALEGLFDLERDHPPPTPVDAAEQLVSTREEWRPSAVDTLHSSPSLPMPLGRTTGRDSGFDRPQTHPTRPSQFAPIHRGESSIFDPGEDLEPEPSPPGERQLPPAPPPEPVDEEPYEAEESSGPETIIGGPLPRGPDYADARLTSELLIDPDTAQGAYLPGTAEAEAIAATEETRPAPNFVRQADSAARWDSPLAKAALTMLALVLGIGLLLQIAHHNRDAWAARWPQMEPMLAAWCGLAGCTIEAPRHLADVHIESSALTPASPPANAQGASAVRLSVVLRNHGPTKVALPSLDVTLTDGAGQTVSRKALSPSDFGVHDPVLPNGAESNLQVVLTTGAQQVAGYTVDVFYP